MDKLDRWYVEQYNEPNVVLNWIRYNIKENSIVLDIGANVGAYAQTFIESGARHVDAYEPDDIMYEYGNKRKVRGVQFHKLGFSDMEGWLPFSHNPHPTNYGLHKIPELAIAQTHPHSGYIKCITLNSLSEKYDIIKIDAEGHEVQILNGGIEYLKRNNSIVILEHEKFNKQECHRIMSTIGYNNKIELNEVNTVYEFK